MLTDIEIAQQAKMKKIREVAEGIGITEDEIENYGPYMAKFSDEYLKKIENNPYGKLILVTAINPTPAGEGKTTVTIGLGDALTCAGKKTMIALREPSLGPCFGIKGGAAGGGYAQVVPMEKLNLPETLASIGKGCFRGCTALPDLTFPATLQTVDRYAFQGCEERTFTFTGDATPGQLRPRRHSALPLRVRPLDLACVQGL